LSEGLGLGLQVLRTRVCVLVTIDRVDFAEQEGASILSCEMIFASKNCIAETLNGVTFSVKSIFYDLKTFIKQILDKIEHDSLLKFGDEDLKATCISEVRV